SKSAVSLGAPLEPRALKHRTRSRAPVGPTVVECPVGNCAPSASTGCDKTPRRRRPNEGGAMPETVYALYVGIDWGTVTHQVAVLDAQRGLGGERVIAHEAVALHAFTEWVMQLAGGEPARVAVALEVPRGAVVDTLLERGFHVFALNPKQLDRFRDRYTVAGAKDDRRDAFVLATALATDRPAFRRLELRAPLIVELREWSRGGDQP